MKTFKIFLAVLIFSTGIAKAQFTKAELQVSGLTCALCAKATDRSLRTLPFIADIKPDLVRNIFVITFKSGQTVDFAQLNKKVQDAGFFVNDLKVTFNFDNTKVADNRFSYGNDTFQLVNGKDKALSGQVAVTMVDKGFVAKSVSNKSPSLVVGAVAKAGKLYHVAI